MIMEILVLNQYFPPDTSATARVLSDIVEAFAEAGHRVRIVAGRPSYDPTRRQRWKPIERESANGVCVERVGSASFSRNLMAGRAVNYLSYLTFALGRGLTLRPDIVFAMTDPPIVSVSASLLAAIRGIPFVYHVQDLHPDMAIATGMISPGYLTRAWESVHRRALQSATRVVVLGEDMRERVVGKGVQPEKVRVVRTGAPIPKSLPPRDHPITREIRQGSSFVLLYAGNLGFAGAWDTVLAAAKELEADDVGLVFVGDGAQGERLRKQATTLRNVRFLPFRPAHEVQHVLQAGDLCLVSVGRGLEGLVVPSKLYPILGAGRPVLAVAPEKSDVARIVRRTRCGWVAEPDDPRAVTVAVREAMSDPAKLAVRGRRARAASAKFDRNRLLGQLVQEVELAVAGEL